MMHLGQCLLLPTASLTSLRPCLPSIIAVDLASIGCRSEITPVNHVPARRGLPRQVCFLLKGKLRWDREIARPAQFVKLQMLFFFRRLYLGEELEIARRFAVQSRRISTLAPRRVSAVLAASMSL